MIRFIWAIFNVSLAPILFWFGGYNFDTHGATAFILASICIFVFFMALTYPGKYPGEKERRE